MNTVSLSLAEYSLPLTRPLPGAGVSISARKGLLVGFESDCGHVGWGDVAPLPGFSVETLDDARQQLEGDGDLHAQIGDLLRDDLTPQTLLEASSTFKAHSSVTFGLETALLNLLAEVSGKAWHHALGRKPLGSVRVNALLQGEELATELEALLDQGFKSIKIKVGKQSPEADAERIREGVELVAGKAVLRLDANRAWTLEQALKFSDELGELEIDYIEEPVNNPHDLAAFSSGSELPLALDESLTDDAFDPDSVPAAAWVIKPTLQGGISGALKLSEAARALDAIPVISAAFESGLGLRALAQLSAVLVDEGVAVGLDTGKWLGADVLEPSLQIVSGQIDVDAICSQSMQVSADADG